MASMTVETAAKGRLVYAVPMAIGKMISLTALLLVSFSVVASAQDEGERAAPIEASTWFGWIGEEPRLEAFEGRAVLLHFFVCKEPKKSHWLGVMRAQQAGLDQELEHGVAFFLLFFLSWLLHGRANRTRLRVAEF